jgi:hypothetical protein
VIFDNLGTHINKINQLISAICATQSSKYQFINANFCLIDFSAFTNSFGIQMQTIFEDGKYYKPDTNKMAKTHAELTPLYQAHLR